MKTRRNGGASACEENAREVEHLPLVVGIQHCIQEDIDPDYLVSQDGKRERKVGGLLKFVLACHGGNPGGKPKKRKSKKKSKRKTKSNLKDRLTNGDPIFETTYLNIFRFGRCAANAESSAYCNEDVSDYKKIMDKASSGLYNECILPTEVIDEVEGKPNKYTKKEPGHPKTRTFKDYQLSNWYNTIDETAGLYLYDESTLPTRLIPVLLFDPTKRHRMNLHQLAMFIELYFGDSLLYTIMCRDYIGPNVERRKLKGPNINYSELFHKKAAAVNIPNNDI